MLKESFDPSVDEQERGCWSGMGLLERDGAGSGQGRGQGQAEGRGSEWTGGTGREGARSGQGAGREGVGSGQREGAGSRIPVSAFPCSNSGSAAENSPGVLADAAELLVCWQRVQRGEAAIFLDVGIPVVPSMCTVLLKCCFTAELLRELLQGSLGFPDSPSLPVGVGSQSKTPRSWDALWQLPVLVMPGPSGTDWAEGCLWLQRHPSYWGFGKPLLWEERGCESLSFRVKSGIPGLVCVLC